MNKTLRPFQVVGRDFLISHPHALLADEMGLGKTIQAIAAVEALSPAPRSVLVVCPASVRLNWRKEIAECGTAAKWDVISYNGAVALSRALSVGSAKWDGIILDEAHFLKTLGSQRTKAIFGNDEKGLARKCNSFRWALTGTPVLNRPRELYPILKTLASSSISPYTTYPKFAQRFCGAYFDGRGIDDRGASHLDDLSRRLQGFMLRRTKAEVMPELPPKVISLIPLSDIPSSLLAPLMEEEARMGEREAFISSVHEDYAQLGDLARLLRITGECKVEAVSSLVEEMLETTDKVVIFAHHREVIRRLNEGLGGVVLHGGMSDKAKEEAVDTFRGDKNCHVFIGQIQAAGMGINGLQEVCSNVVFAELSWVPGIMSQAIDRLHRIGQEAGSVNVYIPYIPGTLEDAVLNVKERKERVIEKLIGSRG